MDKIEKIYQSGFTALNIDDLRILWQETDTDRLKAQVQYYVTKQRLKRVRRGVYVLPGKYDPLELAGKLVVPSYISFETALLRHGLIFQPTTAVTSASRYSRQLTADDHTYNYRKLADTVLLNPTGITAAGHYRLASPERAVGDWLYLGRNPVFDNVRPLTAEGLKNMMGVYLKQTVRHALKKLIAEL